LYQFAADNELEILEAVIENRGGNFEEANFIELNLHDEESTFRPDFSRKVREI
jgi:hypothetical protein